MRPLLSIVVPTKNRYNCLKVLINLFLSTHTSENIELVIADNSDDNSDIDDYLNKLADSRIKYIYTKEAISVCENADKAIMASSGEYVTMIGDDDGYHRDILKFIYRMQELGAQSLITQKIDYKWPGVDSVVFKLSGKIFIKHVSSKLRRLNVNKELKKVLLNGASSLGNLPCVYQSIVKRTVLDEVFHISGTFFPGPSPDMANAIALSCVIDNHFKTSFPLFIAGQCNKSAGGAGARHQHVNNIENVPFLPKDTAANWSRIIPRIWTGETIYGESAIKALERMGRNEYKLNIVSLYAYFVVFHFSLRKYLKGRLKITDYPNFILYILLAFAKRFKFFSRNFLRAAGISSAKKIENLHDIIECESALNSFTQPN